jgi:hypothetical protein
LAFLQSHKMTCTFIIKVGADLEMASFNKSNIWCKTAVYIIGFFWNLLKPILIII